MSESATVSGTLTAAMNQEISRDKKLWQELVTEAAEKGVEPDAAIIRRLGVAWEFEGVQATNAFHADVAAIQLIAKQSGRLKKAQAKVDSFIEDHGEIGELKSQLAEMLRQSRELEQTIKLADHRETATHRYRHQIKRIENQTQRIYGDLQND